MDIHKMRLSGAADTIGEAMAAILENLPPAARQQVVSVLAARLELGDRTAFAEGAAATAKALLHHIDDRSACSDRAPG